MARHQIFHHSFDLLPEKAMYWPELKTLIISDLHLGKAAHFNQRGIGLPAQSIKANNFKRLESLMDIHRPEKLIFLGDLFHSAINPVWGEFQSFLERWPNCDFILVEGNHDILEHRHYLDSGLRVVPNYQYESLVFTHEPMEDVPKDLYNLAGHIHPGARMGAKGQPSLRLPCFYFSSDQAILPAFGSFTGLHPVRPDRNDSVFVIFEGVVKEVS
ncbi:MAG: ligase-associated DNA damage response endonuclease PdeM [Saprospiraceae bacterium]|nr:ligase-associated DNA damage response endonuclease PdeM [Saprospiraceae bacterium]